MKGWEDVAEENAEELRTYAGLMALYKADLEGIEASISSLGIVRNAEGIIKELTVKREETARQAAECRSAMKDAYKRNFDSSVEILIMNTAKDLSMLCAIVMNNTSLS